ncbi:alanine--tRNA ligase [Engelhardtia mirabilis]|uniref:Alanine--tRNA ligase n=1 Tax=Engelhardtia mirabilis TaxID=2528011 RepID=A0A518BKM4_9BACT|nr:Alanine--tRNA ligase [Planctomycetes bacterium Pla133]QDV01851.1 Alanine--tRNA ligase [Planctomycetes bacterium Pla86]
MSSDRSAAAVRRQFLEYFEERGHRVVPSSPVFPQDDPTLLFTNAGMNQFKDVFLGTGTRDYTRAADTQKCIRVSGKHNDLEEVGVDTYHHTFFEMLGNWSFGDYFKRDAIVWAWELLTEKWGLPKDRLWVTVFGGDEADGLPADEEAEELWKTLTDIDHSHVLRFGKGDNFWEMGDTGPCGPCSEIHIDRGEPGSDPMVGADPVAGVNAGNERFIELWNLVFMQFNRMDDGSLKPLPAKSVDTGMGFERVLSVLQGKLSNYDTDLFTPIFERLTAIVGHRYGGSAGEKDIAFRVIADHVRAVSCAFADGALPSNVGRGYVLRRLIRRAARFGRQALGIEQPFLTDLVPTVSKVLGQAFPEVSARIEHIQLLVRSEEEAFGATLGRGLVRFEELAGKVGASGKGSIAGKEAFELYATYGFPRDLVDLMARERGLSVDQAEWDAAESAHQDASRSEGKFTQLLSAEQLDGLPATESTYHQSRAGSGHRSGDGSGDRHGGESVELKAKLLRLVNSAGGRSIAVLDRSPFYAESGGQVGDTGVLRAVDGSFVLTVEDTQKLGSVVAHVGTLSGSAQQGAAVIASVDQERRASIRRNHTATHLLHKALREVLGDHVTQQGSYVGPERLRFDLSHPRGISRDQLDEIEAKVNAQVFANATVATTVEDLEAAKDRGVVALFGEKYDDRVRVVDVGGWSTELCGGTHVSAGGDIGPFVIVAERAIQAGVRRVEAVTGTAAVALIQDQRRVLQGASQALKVAPEELIDRISALQAQLKEAKKAKSAADKADVGALFDQVRAGLTERSGVLSGAVSIPDLGRDALRDLGSRLKGSAADLAAAVFGREGDSVPFLILCEGKALEAGLAAGELAKAAKVHIGGGGGGRANSAQGQGDDPAGVSAAVDAVLASIRASLGD